MLFVPNATALPHHADRNVRAVKIRMKTSMAAAAFLCFELATVASILINRYRQNHAIK
jgi:hypothetical protein